jgi:hypothetical protein
VYAGYSSLKTKGGTTPAVRFENEEGLDITQTFPPTLLIHWCGLWDETMGGHKEFWDYWRYLNWTTTDTVQD